jgi:hypothetical protein
MKEPPYPGDITQKWPSAKYENPGDGHHRWTLAHPTGILSTVVEVWFGCPRENGACHVTISQMGLAPDGKWYEISIFRLRYVERIELDPGLPFVSFILCPLPGFGQRSRQADVFNSGRTHIYVA